MSEEELRYRIQELEKKNRILENKIKNAQVWIALIAVYLLINFLWGFFIGYTSG